MKGRKLRKSWDDVFPDRHMFDFKTEKKSINLNLQDILARHWRSNSATEAESLSSHKISSQSFENPKEGFPSMPEGHTNKKQVSNHQLASLETDTMQDLVEEIAMLELEVTNLEQHLLKLYRQAFTRFYKSSAYNSRSLSSNTLESTQAEQLRDEQVTGIWQDMPQRSTLWVRGEYQQHASARDSPKKDSALHSSNSQPISFPQGTPYQDSLAKCFINSRQRPLAEKKPANAANRLSEDLVKCMAAIYCRFAHLPVLQHEPKISPSSSFSASTFSAHGLSNDGWSSQHKNDASYDGSYNDLYERNYTTETTSTFEVRWICVDDERLTDAAAMLRNFQSLVQQLEGVDPSKMDHEQKLAFWINVHNALVMHAYLAYGIPRNHLKRISLLQKAAYRIGAHTINAQTIEQSILKYRPHRPAKWLHSFLSPAAGKLRGEERKKFAILYPEPLLCFALCWGARSDPAVRVYTHNLIYIQLEYAKQQFLHANVSVHREGKVCLPSILESFAKEASMHPSHLLEWISNHMEGELVTFIDMCRLHAKGKVHKCIEWLQYDLTFRYAFSYPLAI